MAERSTSTVVIDAAPEVIMEVIADFPSYPEWASGVKRTEVLEEGPERAKVVHFDVDVSPIRDSYSLQYVWDEPLNVTWTLVEGGIMRVIDGAYELVPVGENRTEVRYTLAVELSIPMIGMLRRKAEKVIIEQALGGLKKRVESSGDA